MAKDKPNWPARDLKVERAIGRFIIAWGLLEREIDGAIHNLLLTGLRTGALVTANLAVRAKLDLAHALFEQMRTDEDPVWYPLSVEWQKRFDDLVNRTAKANADHRIPIVHSQPMELRLETRTLVFWVKMTARKGGLRGTGVTYTKGSLDDQTKTITTLVGEWAAIRKKWKSAVEAMRSADADSWIGRLPDEEDCLHLQLQSNPGSRKSNSKLSRKRHPSRPRKSTG